MLVDLGYYLCEARCHVQCRVAESCKLPLDRLAETSLRRRTRSAGREARARLEPRVDLGRARERRCSRRILATSACCLLAALVSATDRASVGFLWLGCRFACWLWLWCCSPAHPLIRSSGRRVLQLTIGPNARELNDNTFAARLESKLVNEIASRAARNVRELSTNAASAHSRRTAHRASASAQRAASRTKPPQARPNSQDP